MLLVRSLCSRLPRIWCSSSWGHPLLPCCALDPCCALLRVLLLCAGAAATAVSLCPSHLQAVKAAAIIHLQEGPSTCACLTTCLHPATNTQRLTNLDPVGGSKTGASSCCIYSLDKLLCIQLKLIAVMGSRAGSRAGTVLSFASN